ncbi:TetR/AcrR family transcriptional regulator [Caballeronia zhejiangensis]|uniref:TetR/AcrR family transcriptional regulator n=1 Tax=Caballeronia zhejiangensis TaxID=871203 RepID=UPI001FD5DB50|nr:TetR/AcrR family transcriptional regulator [Caballeronia zhejiangensis]
METVTKELRSRRDPERTRHRILTAAQKEFSGGGFYGARVDRIAQAAGTNERMLYYYFGSKDRLFLAVLDHVLESLKADERSLDLTLLSPEEGVMRVAHFLWDYYRDHPDLVRLLNDENLREGKLTKETTDLRRIVSPGFEALTRALDRGKQAGVFRDDVDPAKLYTVLSALGYYIVSNRFTLEATLGVDLSDPAEARRMRQMNTELVLSYLTHREPVMAAS